MFATAPVHPGLRRPRPRALYPETAVDAPVIGYVIDDTSTPFQRSFQACRHFVVAYMLTQTSWIWNWPSCARRTRCSSSGTGIS
uniref:Uncharacterized protein n=1 Tax=Triticum urartu TaxID=4572 RepID=A0A8R7P3T5_TRIUA